MNNSPFDLDPETGFDKAQNADPLGSSEATGYDSFWIWFWYNDITRFCLLFGLPSIILVVVCWLVIGPGEYLRTVAMITYGVFFAWALLDNDYSNLRRIGMDEYRRKLRT